MERWRGRPAGRACGRAAVLIVLASAFGCTSTARPRPDMGAPAPPPTSVRIIGTVTIADDLLARRMDALAARSATWRAGMDSIQAAGFHMVVAGPAAVRRMVRGLENYAPEHLGEVVPLRDPTGAIAGAVVTIDLPRLERLWRRTGLPRSVFEADVDRILIHEIYGHVVPLAASRSIEGGCPDPKPGAPALSSCAIRRENVIRKELGMEPRLAYDLSGLVIGRYLDRAFFGPNEP
ncbi:MAG: hypothetical protein DIU52_000825 [bacterium]|jgi:hypothetical protein